MKRILPLVALPFAFACTTEPLDPQASAIETRTHADLAPLLAAHDDVQGLAFSALTGTTLVLVENRGILELNADGELIGEKPIGVNGLEPKPYKDLAVIDDGRMLLIADSEGYLWDETSQRFSVHFCVEPGFVDCTDENGQFIDVNANGMCDWDECIDESGALIDSNADAICDWEQCYAADGTVSARDANGLCAGEEPLPVDPEPTPTPEPIEELVQKNDAVALFGQTILAAPRFYDEGVQVEASLRRYELTTGQPTGAVDLTGRGLDVAGLTTTSDGIVGVSDGKLLRFDAQGRLDSASDLDIADAAGVAVVGEELFILDRATRTVKAAPRD